jgi:hypothetical protein
VKTDILGKLKNTKLPPTKALLPMFEAVVNSFHSIEDSDRTAGARIEVYVGRDDPSSTLSPQFTPRVNEFVITDNGVGFNDTNLNSFFTAETQHKSEKGGKGVGRFMWLKAFEFAEIESHYLEGGKMLARRFKFTTADTEPEATARPSQAAAPQTVVRLARMRVPYKDTCPQGLELIGHRLIEHCLPFFLDPQRPEVVLRDDSDSVDLNAFFRDNFEARATDHTFDVGGETFRMRGLRLYGPHEVNHRLLFAAHSREVLHEKLEKHLPNLQKKLADEHGPFMYLGFVEGAHLDRYVNNERTGFNFPAEDSAFYPVSLASIRAAALPFVSADLEPFLADINIVKRAALDTFINDAPQYRPLRRYVDEFIDSIPPGASDRVLDLALHQHLYQKQRDLKQESVTLLAEADKGALKPDEYEQRLNSFLERSNEIGKSSLAEYIVHRRVILEFLEKSLRANPETGKYPLEEIIHRLIYPMKTTSDDVPYEQQNLWIIDERLAFHEFLASDVQLRSMRALVTDSAKRPDLVIFDRPLSFAEGGTWPLTSLVVVEFKKPDPDAPLIRSTGTGADRVRQDPLDQVYDLIRNIKSGHFRDKHGVEIKVSSQSIPAYGYVICEMTAELEKLCENKGMLRTPDGLGFFAYNPDPNITAYVEVISYDKLLLDAKKRNRVLFDKLNLPGT